MARLLGGPIEAIFEPDAGGEDEPGASQRHRRGSSD
jgi:hypothetical protein